MKQALIFLLKLLLVIAVASGPVYAANSRMISFLGEEAVLQRAALRDMLPAEVAYNTPDVHYIGQFNEIYAQNIKADVIILGTSHANRAVNPYWLEQDSMYKYFNFAMDGACPSYYLDWWEQIFVPSGYPTPKLVIFSVDWFMFDSNWLWRRIEQDYKYMQPDKNKNDGAAIPEIELDWTDIDSVLTTVFNRLPVMYARDRLFEMFTVPVLEISDKELKIEDCPYYNGQIAITGNYDGARVIASCASFDNEIEDFKTLLKIFRDSGIPVLFLMVPEYLDGRRARHYEEQVELLNSIASEFEIDFLNYNEEHLTKYSLSAEYYYDWGHMNWDGSTEYSKLLRDDLQPYLEKLIK
ncbi:MAG: hypothetical protein ACYCWE_13995 [Eubacteriales bacterium]